MWCFEMLLKIYYLPHQHLKSTFSIKNLYLELNISTKFKFMNLYICKVTMKIQPSTQDQAILGPSVKVNYSTFDRKSGFLNSFIKVKHLTFNISLSFFNRISKLCNKELENIYIIFKNSNERFYSSFQINKVHLFKHFFVAYNFQ